MSESLNNHKRNGRVLLIYPPSDFIYNYNSQNSTPLDLMYLGSISEKCGFDAQICDYGRGGDFYDDLLEFAPDYLVADIKMSTFKSDLEVLAKAKQLLPSVKIIVKGIPFLTYNTNVTYENPFISYVIIGEAEYTLRDILNGVPDSEIQGICYSDDIFQPIKNEQRALIENLDELPFPARHLVSSGKNKLQTIIEVSRGCPCHCLFCITPTMEGEKVRRRSVESVINEIRECVEKFGIKHFTFKSDVFNMDREWIIDLCKRIIESGIKITWSANTGVDTLDDEMAHLMYKSGCRLCNVGVESGSQIILNKIGKGTTLDDIKKTMIILKKNKIKIRNNFVLGLPWETEETIEKTIQFAIELDSDFVSFNIANPLPGTRYFAYAMMNGLVSGNLDYTNADLKPVIRSHKLSKEKILELRKQAVKRYHLRTKYIIKTMLNLRSVTEFKNFFKMFYSFGGKK